jgi:hypothetical protein
MPTFDAVANVTPATGSSFNISITVPTTNPVLLAGIALSSSTATVSTVTWSLGSGTPLEVKNARFNDCFTSVWAMPAPVAGAGTVAVTLSAPYQAAAETATNAHQTTPCPTADAVGVTQDAGSSMTLTPLNLVAGDLSFGAAANTLAGNPLGISQNDRFKNATTAVNIQAGDSAGTAALTASWDPGGNQSGVGVRVVAPAGGGPPSAGPVIFIPI